jgi:signal peptidase I
MSTETDARETAQGPANDEDAAAVAAPSDPETDAQAAPEAEASEPAAETPAQPEIVAEPVVAEPIASVAVLHPAEPAAVEPDPAPEAPTPAEMPAEVPAAVAPAPEAAVVASAAEEPPSFAAAHGRTEGDDGSAGGDSGEGGDGGDGAKDEFVEIAKTIFYALLIALVLRVLLFQPFTIPSASMEPNLYEGDYIIVSKWNYGYSKHSMPLSPPLFSGRLFDHKPSRGDVVVFKLPRDNKTDYIKRVIGLPGDRIQVRNNQLFINDQQVPAAALGPIDVQTRFGFSRPATKLRETLPNGKQHTMQDFGPDGDLDNTPVFVVPQGHYFMMGDNRDDSVDSRVSPDYGVGFVPEENLVGKAQVILFSWSPGAKLWKPWTWFTHLRPSRFFHALK